MPLKTVWPISLHYLLLQSCHTDSHTRTKTLSGSIQKFTNADTGTLLGAVAVWVVPCTPAGQQDSKRSDRWLVTAHGLHTAAWRTTRVGGYKLKLDSMRCNEVFCILVALEHARLSRLSSWPSEIFSLQRVKRRTSRSKQVMHVLRAGKVPSKFVHACTTSASGSVSTRSCPCGCRSSTIMLFQHIQLSPAATAEKAWTLLSQQLG